MPGTMRKYDLMLAIILTLVYFVDNDFYKQLLLKEAQEISSLLRKMHGLVT
jgi:hypothetical protein